MNSTLCTTFLNSFPKRTDISSKRINISKIVNRKFILYKNFKEITSSLINRLLVNQNVSISQNELNILINLPKVKFTLPFNDSTYHSFITLVGKPNTKHRKAGVYIFTHLPTGNKYVGSSNNLSRRMNQYFNNISFNKDTGLFIPLIKKEGMQVFELEIIVIPPSLMKVDSYSFLFLEQYYLMHESFTLNTHRIVNFRVKQAPLGPLGEKGYTCMIAQVKICTILVHL